MRQKLYYVLHILLYGARDVLPISMYGNDIKSKLSSLYNSIVKCFPALLNVLTITVLIVAVALIVTIYESTDEFLKEKISSDPKAFTIEVSKLLSSGESLKHKDIDALYSITGHGEVNGVYGWNDVLLWFYKEDRSKDSGYSSGRTFDVDDTLLNYLELSGLIADKGVGKIVVTKKFLKNLGYVDNSPDFVFIDYNGLPAKLDVVAIKDWLPNGDYLISEDFNRAINDRRWDPSPAYKRLDIGPLASDSALSANGILKTIEKLNRPIETSVQKLEGNNRWIVLELLGDLYWDERQWNDLVLTAIKKGLNDNQYKTRYFLKQDLSIERKSLNTDEVGYTRASIYMADLEATASMAKYLYSTNYKVINSAADTALFVLQLKKILFGILLAVVSVVVLLAGVSLVLSLVQTMQNKFHEIGVLKAFGASSVWVVSLYIVRVSVVWVVSIAVSTTILILIREAVDKIVVSLLFLANDSQFEKDISLLKLNEITLVKIYFSALLLCWLSAAFVAAIVSLNTQPAVAVKGNR